MRRREFIAGLWSAAAWPLAVRAQQIGQMRRIGVLMADDENDPEGKAFLSAFTQGLAELGWIDGRTVRIDVRWAAGSVDRAWTFAKELVDLQPDVILAHSTPVTAAFQRETRTIPIVFCNVPTRSAPASLPACPARAGILPALVVRTRRWRANGWNCSRRSRPASIGSQPCSIPTRLPMSDHITCPHWRPPPDLLKWRRSQRPFIAKPKSKRS
jgi:ABC transporter substrate binding protein